MNDELTTTERNYIAQLLKERLGTLREGIYHSDTPQFKDELKKEEKTLRALIEKMLPTPIGRTGT